MVTKVKRESRRGGAKKPHNDKQDETFGLEGGTSGEKSKTGEVGEGGETGEEAADGASMVGWE